MQAARAKQIRYMCVYTACIGTLRLRPAVFIINGCDRCVSINSGRYNGVYSWLANVQVQAS